MAAIPGVRLSTWREDVVERVKELTGGEMADVLIDATRSGQKRAQSRI